VIVVRHVRTIGDYIVTCQVAEEGVGFRFQSASNGANSSLLPYCLFPTPNTFGPAGAHRREVKRRSRASEARARGPCDLHPVVGAKNALLGRVRAFLRRLHGQAPCRSGVSDPASPHPVPIPTLGWSVHHAGRGCRTAAPGSCIERRFCRNPHSHLRGPRMTAHPRARIIIRLHTS
jgi:hypothetical protein